MPAELQKLLIVDDDPIFRATVAALLAGGGRWETLTAENGRDALAAWELHANRIALCICDIHMPDCDGIELITSLARGGIHTPLIVVTGALPAVVRSTTILARAHAIPVIDTMRKPVDLRRLQQIASAVLERRDTTATSTIGASLRGPAV